MAQAGKNKWPKLGDYMKKKIKYYIGLLLLSFSAGCFSSQIVNPKESKRDLGISGGFILVYNKDNIAFSEKAKYKGGYTVMECKTGLSDPMNSTDKWIAGSYTSDGFSYHRVTPCFNDDFRVTDVVYFDGDMPVKMKAPEQFKWKSKKNRIVYNGLSVFRTRLEKGKITYAGLKYEQIANPHQFIKDKGSPAYLTKPIYGSYTHDERGAKKHFFDMFMEKEKKGFWFEIAQKTRKRLK